MSRCPLYIGQNYMYYSGFEITVGPIAEARRIALGLGQVVLS
jgi:hypothetical protein